MDYATLASLGAAAAAAGVTAWKGLGTVARFLAVKLFDEKTGLLTRLLAKHLETMDKAQSTMDSVAKAVELQQVRDQRRDAADARRDQMLQEIRESIDSRPCLYRQA